MKALYFKEFGDIDKLVYGDFPTPEPEPGWVLVRVRAASLNWLDIVTRRGLPNIPTPLPMITGGDAVGEVAALGEGVDEGLLGQRVLVMPDYESADGGHSDMLGETRPGALAEFITVHTSQLVPMPDGVGFREAACLPVAYGTARRMLFSRGRISLGEKVLIIGAAGGVGTACVLLCKLAGAYVIGTAGSDEKVSRLLKLGADEAYNYRDDDWVKQVRSKHGAMMRGGGVDVLVNYVGGSTWMPSIRCVKQGARILICGATDGHDASMDLRHIFAGELNILGCDGWVREDQVALLDLCATGKLKPTIDHVFPLSEGVEAVRLLEGRKVFGKIVIEP